jgi:hypothetical protein
MTLLTPAGPRRPVRRPVRPRLEALEGRELLSAWAGYAHDPQHTAVSEVASQSLDGIAWQTPVDLSPQYSGGDLLIHYGSPLVTPSNTVIVPVKTGDTGGFEVEGFAGTDGSLLWSQATDYQLPTHNWTPSYSPTLTPANRLYFAGNGGTVYYIDNPDAPGATITGQFAFFGIDNYRAAPGDFDRSVFINTPLTSDAAGDIYFGFQVIGLNPLGLQSGIARLAPDGTGTWVAAAAAASDPTITKVVHNCAPALSNDGLSLYVAVNTGSGTGSGRGYLLALDSTTLATTARADLRDVTHPSLFANLSDNGSASPTVGPDGDVYFGVLENPFRSSKGWLLHFSADLSQVKTPGAFGWDDTASIVDASLVPSYTGTSPYLLMSKYNNYAGLGGDGVNKIAILDPNDTETDPRTGATVMKEVLTIAGVTPDPEFPGLPGAVREWCINTAVVDPFTRSVLANSEDGNLYRWDLTTNTFTQVVNLTQGFGEAYTPTLVGVDGTAYAINNATLFAVRAAGFLNHSVPASGTTGSRTSAAGRGFQGNVPSAAPGTDAVAAAGAASRAALALPVEAGLLDAARTFIDLEVSQNRAPAARAAGSGQSAFAPFTVPDGGRSLGPVGVNEPASPGGLTVTRGLGWQDLVGPSTLGRTTATARLFDDAGGYLPADAVHNEQG